MTDLAATSARGLPALPLTEGRHPSFLAAMSAPSCMTWRPGARGEARFVSYRGGLTNFSGKNKTAPLGPAGRPLSAFDQRCGRAVDDRLRLKRWHLPRLIIQAQRLYTTDVETAEIYILYQRDNMREGDFQSSLAALFFSMISSCSGLISIDVHDPMRTLHEHSLISGQNSRSLGLSLFTKG